MKSLFKFVIAALIISTFSCQNEGSLPEPEGKVDYRMVDSLLSAPGRYWVIEKITRMKGKEELEYISENKSRNDSLLGVYWHGAIIASVNFQFSDGKIRQSDGGGVWGPLPYTSSGKFYVYNMTYRYGSWNWNNDHSKAIVAVPETLQSILGYISNVDPASFEGHLDPSSYPVYGNVEAIKMAGKSERIKINMEPKDKGRPESYVFTLRAVWLDSDGYGGSRQSLYDKVIY